MDLPEKLILYTAGALLLGWLLGAISTRVNERLRAKQRDPRDRHILELEAKLRIAHGDSEKSEDEITRLVEQLKETTVGLEKRDDVINEQQGQLEKISSDLKDSVIKTHELRAELADRATQTVQAEAKIREVETELSIVQASTDLLATGALQYNFEDDADEYDPELEDALKRISKTAL